MSSARFRIESLAASHDRAAFNCESKPLNTYFHQQVSQDTRRRVTACFVAVGVEQRIAGGYTLASASVLLSDLPAETGSKLPRYPSVPAVRMGRLAVDRDFAGHGLGGALLADALSRVLVSEIAAFALVVDAKDQAVAKSFYQHHGFIALSDQPLTLFLPMATAATAAGR